MARSKINIPKGKLIRIYEHELNSEEDPIELMMTDELSIPIRGEYVSLDDGSTFTSSLLGNLTDELLGGTNWSFISKILGGGRNSRLGFQVYKTSSPLSISANGALRAINNAWDDVIAPIRRLQLLAVPDEDKNGFLTNFPGPSSLATLEGIINFENNYKDCSVKIGRFGFNHVVFKDISTTFSTEVDQTGFPISASVSINFETSFYVTTRMLNKELYNVTDDGLPINGEERGWE